MKKAILLLVTAFLLSPFSEVLADARPASKMPPAPLPQKRKPIVMKWETMGGLRYYYSGVRIDDRESLTKVIGPLNDAEANQLLMDAKHSDDAAVFYFISSSVVLVGGLVLVGTDANVANHSDQVDGQEVAGIVVSALGLVGEYVGLFKMVDGRAGEFEAVQRYNAVIHGDDLDAFHPIHRSGVNADLLTFKF